MLSKFVVSIAVTAFVVAGYPAEALDRAESCEKRKLRAAGKYMYCRLKQESKAVGRGVSPDFAKCDLRFNDTWTRIESWAAGACPTTGDATEFLDLMKQGASAITGSTDNSGTIDGDYGIGDPFVFSGKKYIPLVKAEELTCDWDMAWIMPDAFIIISERSSRVVEVPETGSDLDNPDPSDIGVALSTAIGPSAALHMLQNVPTGPNLWSADRSYVVDGSLLFEPHLTGMPVAMYTRLEAMEMYSMVDWEYHIATYPDLYAQNSADGLRFNMTSSWVQIGDLAPDFEIPMVDGGTFRLSDHSGKIIAFNFCAVT
jgi:hypothetical protein